MLVGALKAGARRSAPRPSASRAQSGGWYRREEAIMGTAISVELWSDSPAQADAAIDAVIGEMHRIDAAMSPHKPTSELSLVNREAARGPVPLSDEMYGLLQRACEFSHRSDGAFDITYAAVGQLYDYRAGVRPTDADIARARVAVGWQQLLLDAATRSVRFAREGMRIDLGGFAKGHAVENAVALLRQHGIAHAVVAAGGDSRLLGDRRGRPWSIGIRDPRRAGEVVAVLPLQDVAVSTSGDYERFFERDGERCHHLIDPRTGKSPGSVRSVTIVAADGLTSEALSKTVFVLGIERGLALVAQTPGADAVVVDAEGRLHFSAGLSSKPARPSPAPHSGRDLDRAATHRAAHRGT